MKERLTGAIILVVLIVLLVPELLSGPSRSAPAPQAAATSSEEPPLRSYTINLADDSHGADTSTGTSNAAPQASGPEQPTPITESPTPAQQANPDAAVSEGSPNSAAPTQAPAPSAASTTSQEQPRPTGSRAQGQSSAPVATPRQRLSAAPHPAAQTERAEPTERSPTTGGSSTGGWMVQLGVFSIQANAERLVQELKSQGFHAQVSENSGGGRPLWRVRTGPVAERTAAEQLNARLRAAGHAGSVVPK
ncbi:MAG TPA: SPOR domain-containing protein [Steroidobacteraceae bacterium]